MKKNKILIIVLMIITLLFCNNTVFANEINIKVDSPSVILIEQKTGNVLYEKNSEEKMYPASTTKIMTAILTLENVEDLKENVTVSYNAVFGVPTDYASDTLKVGEELSVEELLYALLVKSSNEAAVVLAEYIGGSSQSFVSMMNARAQELGATNTNFVNPNGIHNKDHYTTVKDLALIAKHAMQNETFRKIVNTVTHTLPSTNKYDRADRNLVTTNELINKKNKNYYEYAIGIKTGFTSQAKNCLVAGASKDGIELIAVILGADKTDSKGYSIRTKDAKNLFEYVYNNFTKRQVSTANNTIVGEVKVKKATKDTQNLKLMTDTDVDILVTNDKVNEDIQGNLELNQDIKAPISKGTVLGTITYNIEGTEYKANVIASEDVRKSNIILSILGVLVAMLLLFIIYIFMEKSRRKKKKNKYKKVNYLYK